MENDWFSDVTLGSNPILIWADFCFIESVSAAIMLQLYLNLLLNWQDVSCLYILFWLTISKDGIKIYVDDNVIMDTLVG